jgi:hypothetical protein
MMFCVPFLILLSFFPLAAPCHGDQGPSYLLRIEGSRNEEVLIELPVREGDRFSLAYIHSSDQTPVRDTFLIEKEGRLFLIEEAFLWYGAGLEFQQREGLKVVFDEKWTRIQLRRPLPDFRIRVGRVANQIVTFQGRSIPLSSLAKPGEGLSFSIIPIGRENAR